MTPRAPSAPSRGGSGGARQVRRVPSSPGPVSTVSSASAARFAARVRARRLKRIALVTVVLVLVAGIGWGTLASPWARVQRITVTGTERIQVQQVRAVAESLVGSPLLLVDTGALSRAVRQLPLVRDVSVRRVWPSTLVVRVQERQAVAVVPVHGGLALVDRDGVALAQVAKAPPGVPLVQVNLDSDGTAGLRAALEVLDGLPPELRAEVRSIGARGADSVWSDLKDGARVLWGSAGELPTKVQALRALRALPRRDRPAGKVDYDVSAPRAPAMRPRS
jgi:cell division protein FtsQ